MLKSIIFLFILLTVFSCGKTTEEETLDVILDASIEISHGGCQTAIDILEAHGRKNKNAKYLKTLASAYACRANYSTVTFFASDLSLTVTPAPMGGVSTYSTSTPTFQNPLEYDPAFVDLQTAINILLYAGGIASTTEPTVTERAKYFSSAEAADINSQLMFMEMVQIGRIFKVYGNAGVNGVKGAAVPSAGNVCFSDYPLTGLAAGTVTAITNAVAALPGVCKVMNNTGHPQLRSTVTAADRKRRMCHGLVLVNGFLDVLPSVIGSATGSLGTVGTSSQTAINNAKTLLTNAYGAIGIAKSTINQTLCENNSLVPVYDIEAYYSLVIEGLIN